jgi:tRNA 2-thiocytidine biosynthesis protein TtcA
MGLEKRIHRQIGKAIRKHRMIEEGDRLLIAFSGGKDSLVLTHFLGWKRRILPIKFDLVGCHMTTDFKPIVKGHQGAYDAFFDRLGIPLERVHTPILERLEPGKEMNCFYCAMQRRKTLLSMAKKLDCNKIAYGHHMDDIIETLLMNLFYNSKIATMPIRLELDDHDMVIVRPLGYTKERELTTYAKRLGVPVESTECSYAENGSRLRVKKLIAELAKQDPRIRDNLSSALDRVRLGYLREKIRGEH